MAPQRFRATCPKCDADFTLKKAPAGKVTCPECEHRFVFREDDEEVSDDLKEYFYARGAADAAEEERPARGRKRDEEDEDERPARKKRKRDEDEEEEEELPRKRGKKAKQPQGGGNLGIIVLIGGGVLMVAAIVVVIVMLTSGGGGPSGGGGTKDGPGKDGGTKDGGGGKDGPYSTPEATWNTLVKANKSRDHKAYIRAFAPDDRRHLATNLVFPLIQVRYLEAGSPEANQKLQAEHKPVLDVLDRHGLDAKTCEGFRRTLDPAKDAAIRAKLREFIKDPAGLFADLSLASAKLPGGRDRPDPNWDGTISNVNIQGDKATGQLQLAMLPGAPPLTANFLKTGGEWGMVLPPHMKPP
jgi:hypothetical protein